MKPLTIALILPATVVLTAGAVLGTAAAIAFASWDVL